MIKFRLTFLFGLACGVLLAGLICKRQPPYKVYGAAEVQALQDATRSRKLSKEK